MNNTWAIVAATFLAMVLGVPLITNLSLGNKQVDQRIETPIRGPDMPADDVPLQGHDRR